MLSGLLRFTAGGERDAVFGGLKQGGVRIFSVLEEERNPKPETELFFRGGHVSDPGLALPRVTFEVCGKGGAKVKVTPVLGLA